MEQSELRIAEFYEGRPKGHQGDARAHGGLGYLLLAWFLQTSSENTQRIAGTTMTEIETELRQVLRRTTWLVEQRRRQPNRKAFLVGALAK